MHCWGWTVRADSIFACCSHDKSRAEGPPGSSCRGGNGSTLFPSTGHQYTYHLHHLKPPHLHGGHVLKQTAGGKEGDQQSWVWNSRGRVDAAVEGKMETVCKCWPGRQFISEREGCAALALSGAAGIRAEGLCAADKLWQNLFASSSHNPAEGEPWQKRRVFLESYTSIYCFCVRQQLLDYCAAGRIILRIIDGSERLKIRKILPAEHKEEPLPLLHRFLPRNPNSSWGDPKHLRVISRVNTKDIRIE